MVSLPLINLVHSVFFRHQLKYKKFTSLRGTTHTKIITFTCLVLPRQPFGFMFVTYTGTSPLGLHSPPATLMPKLSCGSCNKRFHQMLLQNIYNASTWYKGKILSDFMQIPEKKLTSMITTSLMFISRDKLLQTYFTNYKG